MVDLLEPACSQSALGSASSKTVKVRSRKDDARTFQFGRTQNLEGMKHRFTIYLFCTVFSDFETGPEGPELEDKQVEKKLRFSAQQRTTKGKL